MNYEKLADLLYKDVKSPNYWEEKYPKRNIEGLVTRFAPSPTGYLHIGNFFSAFLDRQIATSTNGVFYFRLEDTDKKREIEGSGEVALGVLNEYGISIDEGLTLKGSVGNYGPYIQSQRDEIYKTYAKELVKKGKAFPCFCQTTQSLDEIKRNRERQLEINENLEEKDECRNLTLEQIESKLQNGIPFALRLKSQGNKDDKVVVNDLILGERELPANCKDVVLIKNNGIPPYCFAHAIDDHLMRTDVVVRGNEWFASVPSHLEIFDALGFERVKYIHTPLICKTDETTGNKRKMSKRKDPEADMRYFKSNGFPKQSFIEYMFTLANSNFEIWRLQNPESDVKEFDFNIEKIGTSNPLFDMAKLCDISKNVIAMMSAEELYDNLCNYCMEFDSEFYEVLRKQKEYSLEVLSIDRGEGKSRKDFSKYSDIKNFYHYMFFTLSKNIKDFELEGINISDMKRFLTNYLNIFDYKDNKETWFNKIKDLANSLGFCVDNKIYKQNPEAYRGNVATVCTYIRIAVTSHKNSPDLWTLTSILKEETKNRIQNLINML